MKVIGRILLILMSGVVLVAIVVYVDGTILPVNHTTSITDTVEAPPAKVFTLITRVGDAPSWRHAVQSVQLLAPDQGRDHWVENLGHGETMNFLATRTDPVNARGEGRREVLLNEASASYGGTWTYELFPGSTPDQTKLRITETGFIHPPLYRFMMAHIFGMKRNLEQYMSDIQTAAKKT